MRTWFDREKGWSSVIYWTCACACASPTYLYGAVAACIMRPRIGSSSSSVSFIWYYKIFIENFNSCAGSSNDVSVEAQWTRHAIRDQTATAAAAHIFRTSLEPHRSPIAHSHSTFVASSFSLFYLSSCFRQKLVRVPADVCDESLFRARVHFCLFTFFLFFVCLRSCHRLLVTQCTHAHNFW